LGEWHNPEPPGGTLASSYDLTALSMKDSLALLELAANHARNIVGLMAMRNDPTRTGGYFTFLRPDQKENNTVNLVIGFYVGTRLSSEQIAKCTQFATEKAHRLFSHPKDITSFQSRDDSDSDKMKHEYGGAIRLACGLIFSFSGYKDWENEAMCVLMARHLGFMQNDHANRIVTASNNLDLRDLISCMCEHNSW